MRCACKFLTAIKGLFKGFNSRDYRMQCRLKLGYNILYAGNKKVFLRALFTPGLNELAFRFRFLHLLSCTLGRIISHNTCKQLRQEKTKKTDDSGAFF